MKTVPTARAAKAARILAAAGVVAGTVLLPAAAHAAPGT